MLATLVAFVMPELDPTIKRVLGFDLSQLFAEMGTAEKRRPRPRRTRSARSVKKPSTVARRKKKPAARKRS